MSVHQLTESKDFTMNVKEDRILNFGRLLLIVLTVFQLQQSSMTEFFACTAGYPLN